MRYCEFCKVHVSTETEACPLCKNLLKDDGSVGKQTYPEQDVDFRRSHLITKIFFFIVFSSISTCVLVNLMMDMTNLWSIVAGSCILYLWLLVQFTCMSRVNLGLKLLTHAIAIPCLLAVINAFCGEEVVSRVTWALSYAIPFILIAFTLAMTITIAITSMRWRDYTLYQISITILGFIPLIFALTGLAAPIWPSIAAAFYSFLTLISTFLFMDKRTKNEIIKRFHI